MDQHDYVLFHPQLRPIDTLTNEIRPTYNNIRFAELLQTTTYRKVCIISKRLFIARVHVLHIVHLHNKILLLIRI